MSARLLAILGAAALVRAQEVSLPVVSPTDTAVVSIPPEGTAGPPTSAPGTLSLSTDVSATDPTVTGTDVWSASLPWITGSTTITTTGEGGSSTTDTIGGGPSSTGTDSSSVHTVTATSTVSTSSGYGNGTFTTTDSSGHPTTVRTVTSTSTDGGSPTESSGGGDDSGSPTQPPDAAAPRVEQAMGVGFVAVVAGLLAL